MREKILGFLVYVIYRTLMFTWRIKLVESPEMQDFMKNKKPFIMAHWHGDELALLHLMPRYRVATLSSKSKDGEIMAFVLNRLGAQVVRGSSIRNAVGGFLSLMRLVRKGHSCSFAVDGPKGPIYKAKAGVLEASKNLKAPIICGGAVASRAWVFEKAWNKTFLPKPFARICVVWQKPLPIPDEINLTDEKAALETIESSIHAAKQQALGFIAGSPG